MARLISRAEAAELLDVTLQTVSNWVERGIFKATKIGGKTYVDRNTIEILFDTEDDLCKSKKAYDALLNEYKEKQMQLEEQLEDIRRTLGCSSASFIKKDILHSIIRGYSPVLTTMEQYVLDMLIENYTFEEICENFKLSRERVRQIAEKACREIAVAERYADVKKRNEKLAEDVNLLHYSCNVLKEHIEELNKCIFELRAEKEEEEKAKSYQLTRDDIERCKLLLTPIKETDLPVRVINCLCAYNARVVADMVKMSRKELLELRNFGRKHLTMVDEWMEKNCLSREMPIDNLLKSYSYYCVENVKS